MLKLRQFTFNPFGENTYVIYNQSQQAVIIDPGCYGAAEEAVLQAFIEKENLQPTALWLTHAHIDHVLGNHFVHQQWGLQARVHADEQANLDRLPTYAPVFGFPPLAVPPVLDYLKEGQTLRLGDAELFCIWAPGHSAGSICFYYPQGGWLIGGDVLFRESIGRTDLPGGDFDTLIQSIRTKLFSLPDETVVYPGHGPATSIGHEKAHNPFVRA